MHSIDILRQNEPLWGEWSLGQNIGSGVQSQVFLVSGGAGELRALKVITMGKNSEQQEAVREQVDFTERMGQLDGVVPCLRTAEFGEGNDRIAVMLMPLLTPLSDILLENDEDMSAEDVMGIAHDLCEALVECQQSGVIHRDIKPANVFADENGKYYLGDLGVARNLEHTMLATRKGTPAYMSPEIASGRPCSYSSDIYSLGIMLYQLLNAGRLPLLGRDARYTEIEEAVERRLNGEPLPLPENAHNRLGRLVCDMCSADPKKRPSAQQCLEEIDKLKRVLAQEGELPPARIRLNIQTNPRLIICGAALLLSALMFLVIFVAKGGRFTAFPSASSPAVNAFSGGGVASDEEWLYLGSNEAGNSACRISKSDGAAEIIYNGSITHLNLRKDRMFFTANHTIERAEKQEDGSVIAYMRGGVRSMNPDGTDEKILCECDTTSIVEYDGWIYHYVSDAGRDGEGDAPSSQIMRVKNNGRREQTLCSLPGVYVNGMYVYRERIYLTCTDYTSEEKTSYVMSMALDGSDTMRVIDGHTGCIDFIDDYICYTANKLQGSQIIKKKLNSDEPAFIVSDMQAAMFCVYKDHFIICTAESFDEAANDDCGVYLCDADQNPTHMLLDESVSRMELAGDVLIVETKDYRMLAVDIVSGEITQLEDFRFELY